MSVWIAIILGIIQGLTEFLPVSSSGHLVLAEKLFGLDGDNLSFNIIVHLGSLLAVIIIYRKKLLTMIKQPLSKDTLMLGCATIPTVIIFLLFKDFFESSFSGKYLAICFFVTAIMLMISSYMMKKSSSQLSYKTVITMGIFQGLAIIPGISRSGSTLTGGLCMRTKREEVADFSFLMSIPVILGSLVLEIFDGGFVGAQALPLIFGFIFSFLSGFLSIKFMLRAIKNKSLYPFAIYLAVLTVITLVIF